MRHAVRILMVMVCLSAASRAIGSTITLSPSNVTIAPGEHVTVEVQYTDLGAIPIAGFDVRYAFDSGVLVFVGAEFDGALGDEAAGESVTSVLTGPGEVSAAQVSFLSLAELMALQGTPSLVLARFIFEGASPGTSPLEATHAVTVDADGVEGAATAPGGLVRVTNVPEPASLSVVLCGCSAAIYLTRTRRIRARHE